MDVDDEGGGGDGGDGSEPDFFFLEVFQGNPTDDPGCSYRKINLMETGYALRVSIKRFKDWSKRTLLAQNILGFFNQALAKNGDDFEEGKMEQPYDCSNPQLGDIHVYFVKKNADSPMRSDVYELFKLLYMVGKSAIPFASARGLETYLETEITNQPPSVRVIKFVKE